MKRITAEQYRELDGRMCDLQYRLDCLDLRKDEMSYEDYMRERSVLNHKIECLEARIEGKWKKASETYKYDGYEQY